MFINVLKFATPLYMLQVLDRVPASRSVETLVMLTLAILVAVIAGLALENVRRRMFARWGIWIEQQFGPRLFYDSLIVRSIGQPPTVQASLDDLSKVRNFVTKSAAPWFDIVWAPFFVYGAYLVHPVLGTIGLIAIAVVIVLGVLQELFTREPRRSSRQASDEAEHLVAAAERNFETVGALTMTTNLTRRWRQRVIAHLDDRDRSEARVSVFMALRRGLGQCMHIGLLGVGVWLYLHGSLTLGGIFAGRIMTGFGYSLVERAVKSWRALKDSQASYQNVKRRLADEEALRISVHNATPEAPLVLENVSFRHPEQNDSIIKRLSLTIEPGEFVVVTGTAGTGKTTLSRLLVGILEPRSGQIRLGDIEIGRLPLEMRAELVGYLPQHTELFRGTVRENIGRMGEGNFEDILVAAKRVGIHDIIIRLPQGYDTEIGEEAAGLSGSERKRIALARAICGNPRILVLDEPTANLDRQARRALESAIVGLKQSGSSIVITQAIASSRWKGVADKFLILGGQTPEISVAQQDEESEETKKSGGLRSVK
jgi:PrtD family type I secretion system ABC transporter